VNGKKILLTGGNGFLGKHLCKYLSTNNDIIVYDKDIRLPITEILDIDTIIHLASPTDFEDLKDANKVVTTIIDGTLNMLNLARKTKSKFIFASTMGVYDKNLYYNYGNCKLSMENYIINTYKEYIILRIPRVYDKSKIKGLMKQLRRGTVKESDLNNIVNFIYIDEFIDQTLKYINNKNGVYEYINIQQDTIRNISHACDINAY
jgi:nucleoside-diphosphate-sugar epimerase|tara:strand:+ start:2345 stop:2959 length:615 start_codon:yes stop_codon:yes gene_type:complete